MIEYTINYHVGTPSKSKVVYSEKVYAENDIEANRLRVEAENKDFKYDFNTLCQTSYLAKHGLADSLQRVL